MMLMLGSSMVSTIKHPKTMNFILLPTELMELIVFDTGARRHRADQEGQARRRHESLRELVKRRGGRGGSPRPSSTRGSHADSCASSAMSV